MSRLVGRCEKAKVNGKKKSIVLIGFNLTGKANSSLFVLIIFKCTSVSLTSYAIILFKKFQKYTSGISERSAWDMENTRIYIYEEKRKLLRKRNGSLLKIWRNEVRAEYIYKRTFILGLMLFFPKLKIDHQVRPHYLGLCLHWKAQFCVFAYKLPRSKKKPAK